MWTAPPGLLGGGALTGDVFAMVKGAATSVVCATYNLQPTSVLWKAMVFLAQERPGVAVRLYVDTQAADGRFAGAGRSRRTPGLRPGARGGRQAGGRGGRQAGGMGAGVAASRGSALSTGDMARGLTGAVVMRTRAPRQGERPVTSHAKFLSVDHRYLLVGSANFSRSAEERNVELGLRVDDPALAASVEKQMRDLEANVYERVMP